MRIDNAKLHCCIRATPLLGRHLAALAVALLFCNDNATASTATIEGKSALQNTIHVRYPLVQDAHERDFDTYFLELLQLALQHSEHPFELTPVKVPLLVESRSEHLLRAAHYDIHWLNTTVQRERELRAIRVPLFKGLIGWRIFFIRTQRQAEFNTIHSLSQLRNFKAGQGHDWPDNAILSNNGLPLITTSNWDSLFKMLKSERIDYFPRSLIEIGRERRLYPSPELAIETNLALRYPAAYYFFVNKNDNELANTIEKGLLKAIATGAFNQVFEDYFTEIIQQAQLAKRTVLDLNRNDLAFPKASQLWFHSGNNAASNQH